MMASGPAGESEVLSLLKVISDPNGAKERLGLLAERADALAKQEEAFNKNASETTARIAEAQSKADADSATAAENLVRANKLLASAEAKEIEIDKKAARLDALAGDLAKRERAVGDAERAASISAQEKSDELSDRERNALALMEQAKADAEAAANLKSKLEVKLEQLRAIAG